MAVGWRHPAFPYLAASGRLGFRSLPLGSAAPLEAWTSSVGAAAVLDIGSLAVHATGGFGAVWWEQQSATGDWDWDLAWRGGLGLTWRITSWLAAELALEYQTLGAVHEGLVGTIGVGVHVAPLLRPARLALIKLGEQDPAEAAATRDTGPADSSDPGSAADEEAGAGSAADGSAPAGDDTQPEGAPSGPQPLHVLSSQLDPLFAAIYRSYRDRPVGRVVVDNPNDQALEDLRARVTVTGVAVRQQQLEVPRRLEAGARLEIPLTLPAAVGSVSRATRIELTVQLAYSLGGQQQEQSLSVAGQLYGYESMGWTDTRRAAVFVTPEQPVVSRFAAAARSVAGGRPLATVAALWAGLSEAGVTHTRDFFTPFGDALHDTANIDFVRYPVQTLAERWGDDLELSLLLASLLEAADVASALVISDGRALVAVALGADADRVPAELADAVWSVAGAR